MTKRDVVSISIKVFGVVFLANAVGQITGGIYQSMAVFALRIEVPFPRMAYVFWLAGGIALQLLIAWVLLGSADAIARRLVPDDAELRVAGVAMQSVVEAALRVVGVVIVAYALPDFVKSVVMAIIDTRLTVGPGNGLMETFAMSASKLEWKVVLQAAAQIAVGVYLALRCTQVAALLYHERPKADPDANL